jgi:hypothetical protein
MVRARILIEFIAGRIDREERLRREQALDRYARHRNNRREANSLVARMGACNYGR